MEDFKFFDSIRKYFESYFGKKSFFETYHDSFYLFSFESNLENSLKKDFSDKSLSLLEDFLRLNQVKKSFVEREKTIKLNNEYFYFVNSENKSGKLNFVFFRKL